MTWNCFSTWRGRQTLLRQACPRSSATATTLTFAFGDARVHGDYMRLCFNLEKEGEEAEEALRERERVEIGDAIDSDPGR